MFGLPLWGIAIASCLLGGGMIWILWKQLQQGAKDKVRADTDDSYIAGNVEAEKTEAKLKQARDNALNSDHADTEL